MKTPARYTSRHILLLLLALTLPMLSACGNMQAKGPGARMHAATSSAPYRAASMLPASDADSDGVADAQDRCQNTPVGQAVDSRGCTAQIFLKVTLQYGSGQTGVPANADYRLYSVAKVLYENPQAEVVIHGHDDTAAADASQRIQAVKRTLMNKYNVPASHIQVRNHGASKPLVSHAGSSRNRRVELVINGPYWAPTGDEIPKQAMVINFATGTSLLTPKSRKSLQAIGRYLQAHPGAQARITARHGAGGRVDARLAKARADNILGYLARHYGVEPEQLAVEFLDGPQVSMRAPAAERAKGAAKASTSLAARELPQGGAVKRLLAASDMQQAASQQKNGRAQASVAKPASQRTAALAGSVCFSSAQASVSGEAWQDIDAIGRLLAQSPNARCVLAGHTDSRGSMKGNLTLSRKRAEKVKQYLMQRYNIAASQLEVQAFGESQPIANNKTSDGRSKNRRVEFRVIS